jgi:hypothetical protein
LIVVAVVFLGFNPIGSIDVILRAAEGGVTLRASPLDLALGDPEYIEEPKICGCRL